MLKHYHTRNLRLLADDNEMCDTCKIFNPMKDGVVTQPDDAFSASGNKVKNCIIDDVEGFANLKKANSATRFSCVKFAISKITSSLIKLNLRYLLYVSAIYLMHLINPSSLETLYNFVKISIALELYVDELFFGFSYNK